MIAIVGERTARPLMLRRTAWILAAKSRNSRYIGNLYSLCRVGPFIKFEFISLGIGQARPLCISSNC
jgi:hypothetical protein